MISKELCVAVMALCAVKLVTSGTDDVPATTPTAVNNFVPASLNNFTFPAVSNVTPAAINNFTGEQAVKFPELRACFRVKTT